MIIILHIKYIECMGIKVMMSASHVYITPSLVINCLLKRPKGRVYMYNGYMSVGVCSYVEGGMSV